MLYMKIGVVVAFNIILLVAEGLVVNITFPIIIAYELMPIENAVPIAALLIFGAICLANAMLMKTGTYTIIFEMLEREVIKHDSIQKP